MAWVRFLQFSAGESPDGVGRVLVHAVDVLRVDEGGQLVDVPPGAAGLVAVDGRSLEIQTLAGAEEVVTRRDDDRQAVGEVVDAGSDTTVCRIWLQRLGEDEVVADELAEHWEELVNLARVVLVRVDRPADKTDIGKKVAGVALDVSGRIGVEGPNLVTFPGTSSTSSTVPPRSGRRQQGVPGVDK